MSIEVEKNPRSRQLGPNVLMGESYVLGNVKSIESIDPIRFGLVADLRPAAIYSVEIEDPYFAMVDPRIAEELRVLEQQADRDARVRREAGMWQRERGTAYIDSDGVTAEKNRHVWGDPVTNDKFFRNLDSPALNAWQRLIPSAEALRILSDPVTVSAINVGNESVAVDDTARLWLAASTDALSIRNRGSVLAPLVKEFIGKAGSVNGSDLKWMSVACGTALPSMKAAINAGVSPHLILADVDETALRATHELGQQIGYDGILSQHRINIFHPGHMARLRKYLGDNGGRPKLIDLMGIFEYAGEHTGVNPAEFLRSIYDMLHPGGRMIFGQMLKDRPLPDFTMGVVGWPFIEMRNPPEVMQIVREARIPVSEVELYFPSDGVNMVGVIDKPLGAEHFSVAA